MANPTHQVPSWLTNWAVQRKQWDGIVKTPLPLWEKFPNFFFVQMKDSFTHMIVYCLYTADEKYDNDSDDYEDIFETVAERC